VKRRRIWSEFLPPEELGARATIDLLLRFGIEPIVALPPHAETEAMALAFERLTRAGVSFGVWPLLSDEKGYWPSEENADAFYERVQDILQFVDASQSNVRTVAIDLEPPLWLVEKLSAVILLRGFAELPFRREQRRRSIDALIRIARVLHGRGLETIAAVLPPIVLDLRIKNDLWQGVLRTPVRAPGWSVLSPMMYTTLISRLLPPPRRVLARRLLFEAGRMLVKSVGPERASLSIGLVTQGKLGNEPAFASPRDLELDVAAAVAAGVKDLALFSLEGVLHRGSPETWLARF
jgi:hypothetical protein